jgi:hypothetical protein
MAFMQVSQSGGSNVVVAVHAGASALASLDPEEEPPEDEDELDEPSAVGASEVDESSVDPPLLLLLFPPSSPGAFVVLLEHPPNAAMAARPAKLTPRTPNKDLLFIGHLFSEMAKRPQALQGTNSLPAVTSRCVNFPRGMLLGRRTVAEPSTNPTT